MLAISLIERLHSLVNELQHARCLYNQRLGMRSMGVEKSKISSFAKAHVGVAFC